MPNPYEIDFSADLTGPLGLLGQAIRAGQQRRISRENAETQRKYADANMAIASARAKREEAEFKAKQQERQHALDVERSQQLGPLGAIARRMSPEFATEMGKPYGISFTQGQPQGHVQSPFANAGFGEHAQQTLAGQTPEDTARLTGEAAATLQPGEEGPEVNPYSEAMRFPGTEQPEAPQMEGPEYDPVALESDRLASIQRPLLVNVAGRSFELPQMNDSTGLGKEYDDMYERLLMSPGVKPADALKAVYAEHQKNTAEEGRMTRAANMLDQRNANREDQQAFIGGENEKYRNEGLTFDRRMQMIDRAGRYKVAASAPALKADAANARDMSVLRQASADIRATGQYAKLLEKKRALDAAEINIKPTAVALQNKDAQIQLARIFRGAQPTEGEMHMLYDSLGGTADKWNQFVARITTGGLSPEQLRQLRKSVDAQRHEIGRMTDDFMRMAQRRLGRNSGFDNMPDQADAIYQGFADELGVKLPPLYDTEVVSGGTLGSGKRPTVKSRGTKKTELDHIEEYLDSLGGSGGR